MNDMQIITKASKKVTFQVIAHTFFFLVLIFHSGIVSYVIF